MSRQADLYYWEGELPPPLPVRYEDENGALVTTIAGASFVAKTRIDGEASVDVACTDGGDGTLTIDWPTPTSVFTIPAAASQDSIMTIDVQVTQGALVWYLPRFSVPIKKRT